ncbi:MAG: hypothetical protein KY450_01335 [Actinobacteria bacterium]|nr:hypothetical protein [Actinomycetota bacterium]
MSVMLVLGLSVAAIAPAQAATISVSAGGDIQAAINKANPGDTIVLVSGTYKRDFYTVRNGSSSAPIRITGPRDAVLKGAGSSRIAQVHHDFITLDGFTIDGLHGSSTSASGYRDKLIYAIGKVAGDGVKNLRINNMLLKNAGGECVRIKYLAENNVVENSTITNCGVYDFKFGGTGKNGEGIYIGTAPEQTSLNPSNVRDVSKNNVVRNNTFDTQGNECVDIKEGSTANVVSGNSCTGQKDPNSAGLDSRGSGNTFDDNRSFNNVGAGVRLGGDTSSDGTNNNVRRNELYGNGVGGIKFMATPQGEICGNYGAQRGSAVGTYGSQFDPDKPCPTDSTTTTSSTTTTAPTGDTTTTTAPSGDPSADCVKLESEIHKWDYDAIQVGITNTSVDNAQAELHRVGCGTGDPTTNPADSTSGYTTEEFTGCQTLHDSLHALRAGAESSGASASILDVLESELHRVGCGTGEPTTTTTTSTTSTTSSTTTTTAPTSSGPTAGCKTYHTEQHKRDYDAIQVGVSNTVINDTEAALHNKGCGGTTSATTEGPDTTTGYTSRQLLRCQTLHSRLHTYYKGTEAAGVDLDPLDAELHRVGC